MTNKFCHIELTTDDVGRATEFYGNLFSWKFEKVPMGEGSYYTMFKTGEDPGGGIMAKPQPGVPTMWLPYVQVENVTATLKKVEKLGGKVNMTKTPIPGMGSFGVFTDPSGGVLAVWEVATK